MAFNRKKIRIIYTISVFIGLAAFDNIVIGLFPPLFSLIAKDFDVHVSALGYVSAANILVTCVSSVYWGYLAGKGNRKKYIIIGTVIWAVSVFLTSFSRNYAQLLVLQIFTGVGLGCIASIGYSILTDYIPNRYRGMLLSLWGMSQGFGGIAGALMASLIASSTSWRIPFEIVGVIGFLLLPLYLFVREPDMGESEPELKELKEKGLNYNYKIEIKQLNGIISKPSNIWLLFQGFFMNIATGTLIWLPTLYISKIEHAGFSVQTAVIASGYLFAMFQLGGLTSSYFGHLGDVFQRRTYKGRAYLAAIAVFLAAPAYIAMFMIPMKNLSLPDNGNQIMVLLQLLKEIILNPWLMLMFVLSFVAAAAQSANTPNWMALITEVNLPEHRATVFSLANLIGGIGRTIGNAGVGIVLAYVSGFTNEPNNYIITLVLFQVIFVPAALCYLKMARFNVIDIKRVRFTLRRRGRS
ncbi:MFS transporter [Parasporobacterium paucivorans]|uniref:Sugar phosphate permease n=1 Tax=Parasporobacterium paucivorans DSM 15970 TaxID=1122934 RepID=A0A1M6D2Q9_9FIRM|nr:MFS transporter [Parasporobacterium paucivorans]SHI67411.1 Sugar phosphate permease [Parasporobacterium paucivorans DSM 15970]